MAIHQLYQDIRFKDRPVDRVLDPETFALEPGAVTAPYEAKRPEKLADLYPEIDRFLTYSTDRYQSREVMEREWDCLWTRIWQIAGRASDIPEVGDWFRYDIGRESIIVVRSAPDRVRAFYNVCKHRGNRLVSDEFGKGFRSFSCIVHSWRWDLNGRNVRVTDRDTFKEEALCGDLALGEVHVAQWGGFIFINMAENPQPFDDYFGTFLPTLESYRMEEMFVIKDVSVAVPANWKVIVDTFSEAYHAHATHPQILPFIEDHFTQTDFYPNGHNRMLAPNMAVSVRWPERDRITDLLSMFAQEAGLDLDYFAQNATQVRRAMQAAKRKPGNPYGIDYSRFTDNQLTDDWNPSLFPNITFNAHPEGVLFMRMRPHADDPEWSYYDAMVLTPRLADGVRPPSYMGVDPDIDISGQTRPARLHTMMDDPQVGEVLEQDLFNIANMQKGMRSRGLKSVIRFSQQEGRVQQFHAELERYLDGRK